MKSLFTKKKLPKWEIYDISGKKVVAQNSNHLAALIDAAIAKSGNECDLNFIDVSRITDMSYLFFYSKFKGDISKWDVGNVDDMSDMFTGSPLEDNPPKWYKE